jgi:hypothetical protein
LDHNGYHFLNLLLILLNILWWLEAVEAVGQMVVGQVEEAVY